MGTLSIIPRFENSSSFRRLVTNYPLQIHHQLYFKHHQPPLQTHHQLKHQSSSSNTPTIPISSTPSSPHHATNYPLQRHHQLQTPSTIFYESSSNTMLFNPLAIFSKRTINYGLKTHHQLSYARCCSFLIAPYPLFWRSWSVTGHAREARCLSSRRSIAFHVMKPRIPESIVQPGGACFSRC